MIWLIMSGIKHGRDFEKFRKEVLASGQTVFSYDNGSVTYRYGFAELQGLALVRSTKATAHHGEDVLEFAYI